MNSKKLMTFRKFPEGPVARILVPGKSLQWFCVVDIKVGETTACSIGANIILKQGTAKLHGPYVIDWRTLHNGLGIFFAEV